MLLLKVKAGAEKKVGNMKINIDNLDFSRHDKPYQSAWLDFVRKHPAEILNLGEFEALRRWILGKPKCVIVQVVPETSHRVARDFFKALRKEQKQG